MRKGKIIEKYIVPRFEDYGYTYEKDTPMAYQFYNWDKTVWVSYELTPDARFLRLEFTVSYGTKAEGVRTNDLAGVERPYPYELYCPDNDAFRQAAEVHTSCALEIVLPVLDRVRLWLTPVRYELYRELSKDPEGRAAAFAAYHDRTLLPTEENCRWAKDWCIEQLPEDPIIRDFIFQENMDAFLGLIAYMGELWRPVARGRWGWFPSFYGRFSEPLEFGILYEELYNGEPGADPLAEFLRFWNFYGVLQKPMFFFDL